MVCAQISYDMANTIRPLPLVNKRPLTQIHLSDLPSLSIHHVGVRDNNNNKQRTIYPTMFSLLSNRAHPTTERLQK